MELSRSAGCCGSLHVGTTRECLTCRADPAKASARCRRDAELCVEIQRVHAANFGVYGARNWWYRISHEAIYQALYIQGRGALQRELTRCLRTGRALRVPRARTRGRGKSFISPQVMISERPAEADDRAVPGHWEGDLILGLDQLRNRHPGRAHDAVHDAAAPAAHAGPWRRSRAKNGPALAGMVPRPCATPSPARSPPCRRR